MAVARSEADKEKLRLFFKNSQEKALNLLAHAEAVSGTVFSKLENLISFLDLTSRLHHYNGYNLLLIWERNPSVTWLAAYKFWENSVPPGSQVLKKEHFGKGLDLIAPFTEGANGRNYLVWYTVNVFDISQTNCKLQPPGFDPAYIQDTEHVYFLIDAVKMTLGAKFDRIVSIEHPSQHLQDAGAPGQITEKAVIARDDLPPEELLQWLTEALALLVIDGTGFNNPTILLLRDCIRYCLFRIWGLTDHAHPPASTVQLRSVGVYALPFIHLLRDSVRTLNNLVCGFYTASRQDFIDLDEADLLSLN